MQIDVDLGTLAFADGGHLLVKRLLRKAGAGQPISVAGTAPQLDVDLRAWCRAEGHEFSWHAGSNGQPAHAVILNGGAAASRWTGAERAGQADAAKENAVVTHPPRRWGLAARSAMVESGTPDFDFNLVDKTEVWADDAARLYAQAVAAQWIRRPRFRGRRRSSGMTTSRTPSCRS